MRRGIWNVLAVSELALSLATGIPLSIRGEEPTKIGGRSASEWIAILRSNDSKTHANASLALSLFGPAARGVVPELIEALDDPRRDVQSGAAKVLTEIGPDAVAAAPALVRKLGIRDSGLGIASSASAALSAIGPAAVTSLIKGLERDNKVARCDAAQILERLGPLAKDAAPSLAKLVLAPDESEAGYMVGALAAIGAEAHTTIPALYAAYDSVKLKDGNQMEHVLSALVKIGASPSRGMISDLNDPDPDRRADAITTLSDFGARAQFTVGRLEALLSDPSPSVQVKAVVALCNVDPANPRVLPALWSALDSTELDVLNDAIAAIAKLGPRGVDAAPSLKKVIARTNLTNGKEIGNDLAYEVRQTKARAAEALVAVAPCSGEGVAALIALMKDGDNGEWAAIEALERLGPRAAAAVPALVAVARNARSEKCFDAIQALIRINDDHDAIVPALVELVSVEPPPVERGENLGVTDGSHGKVAVVITIGRLGVRALSAVPSLVRLLKAESEDESKPRQSDEKVAAIRALGRIGPAAKAAVPALVRVMKTDTGRDARIAAIHSLGALGPAASSAAPFLVEMLSLEAPFPSTAARALGSIGPAARAAVPALGKCLNDNTSGVVPDAAVALLRIDPSQRNLVEARLRSIPVTNQLYARAVLSGALGWRTPEADGFVRRDLRAIHTVLRRLAALTAEHDLSFQDDLLRTIGLQMENLSSFGVAAEGAVGRLTELSHHAEPEVRRLAAEALNRIRPK
jgi:HEAT repeat protein